MRQKGFYWVKIVNQYYTGESSNWRWAVAEFDGSFWYYQGCRYNDENFQQIDETKIERK